MLSLISPAKTLDLESRLPRVKATSHRFEEQTRELVEIMRTKSPADISSLMGISDELAALNATRYAEFSFPIAAPHARPAILTFAGDVYQGLDAAHRFDTRDFTEAGKVLRILSGLFGLLRPLDLIEPYRLEMGIRLANPHGKDLYAYWRDQLTPVLAEDLAASPGSACLVNLASEEYFGAVDVDELGIRVISPRFEDRNPKGEWKVQSFFAKRARGMMAGWLVTNRVHSPRGLLDFDEAGYRFAKDVSTSDVPVFRRER